MNAISYFSHGGEAIGGLVCIVLLWALILVTSRRFGRRLSRGRALAYAAPMGLILGPTLLRGTVGFHLGSVFDWSGTGWDRVSSDPITSQVVLNAALFVPAGVVYAYLSRTLFRVAICLIVLSLTVECLQGLTTAGVPDPADVLVNGIGGALGAVVGFLGSVLASVIARRGVNWGAVGARLVGVLACSAIAVVLVNLGATHQLNETRVRLKGLYASSSLEQYRAWEADDAGGGLYAHVFRPPGMDNSRMVNGGSSAESKVTQRYPASFFGVRQCVFVTWLPNRTTLQNAEGEACTRPMVD